MSQSYAVTNASPTEHAPPAPTSTPTPTPTPTPTQPAPVQSQHKRVYQACIPCRRRKVRCDLGSVDNPHDPPCVRCRRESKECYFSATRRKRKNDDEGEDEGDEDYIVRNGRKRHHQADTSSPAPPFHNKHYSSVPLTPGAGAPAGRRSQPLRRPDSDGTPTTGSGRDAGLSDVGTEPNTQLENLEAQSVMRREVYGPHDALDLLYKAATDSPHNPSLHRRQESSVTTTAMQPSPTPVPGRKPEPDQLPNRHMPTLARMKPEPDPIDPRLLPAQGEDEVDAIERRLDYSNDPGYEEALKAWSKFRFVRAGWFTKEEAIKYIAYYYEFLSPMTPISPPTFRGPASHDTLLTEEPILAVTLLTISSRYYRLKGTGGHCRSHAIHEELWRYLRRMIERCFWGQEAFGGGFCGSGADESQTSSTAPWRGMRKGSLRTLGTIESLMVLTEWHPRALHFPPDEAIDELMLPSYDGRDSMNTDDGVNAHLGGGVGGRRIESWLEPAWRSDRMCWMLLSAAQGLAYELGVFDDIDELLVANAITRPEYNDEGYRLRATRIKRLLLIYQTQLAGRLGWTNMVPESIRQKDPALVALARMRRPTSNEGNTPGTNNSSNTFIYVPDVELDDQIIHCWVGVSNAMHIGNEQIFKSRKHTTDIIQSGKYTTMLKEFQPILREWWKDFERFRMPPFIRHILTIEYEYVRIYINSLALQAVVERCTNNAGNTNYAGQGHNHKGEAANQLSPQTQNYFGAIPLGALGGFGVEDQEFVKEVVDGCRNLLRTVVDGLLPDGYLKHAPVRTYFRIISGAMFLLKTFALGAPRSDVELSISLMDRTVEALRTCVVDDVHLGTRFGDLLESLTNRLRSRFKHAPVQNDGRSPNPNGGSRASSINGHPHSNGPEMAYTSHASKLKDELSAPNRSSTPALPISATPFDLNTGNFPYPTGSASVFGPTTPAHSSNVIDTSILGDSVFDTGNDWTNPEDQTWYLPLGPGLFQNMGENSNVTMTDQGVNVGGLDLLEYMTMDMDASHFNNPMDGSSYQ